MSGSPETGHEFLRSVAVVITSIGALSFAGCSSANFDRQPVPSIAPSISELHPASSKPTTAPTTTKASPKQVSTKPQASKSAALPAPNKTGPSHLECFLQPGPDQAVPAINPYHGIRFTPECANLEERSPGYAAMPGCYVKGRTVTGVWEIFDPKKSDVNSTKEGAPTYTPLPTKKAAYPTVVCVVDLSATSAPVSLPR